MSLNDDESGESSPPSDPPSPKPTANNSQGTHQPKRRIRTRRKKGPSKPPPSTPSATTASTPNTPDNPPDNPDRKPTALPRTIPETPKSTPGSSRKSNQNRQNGSSKQSSPHSSPPDAQDPRLWDWNISDNEILNIPEQHFDLDLDFLQNQQKGLGFSENCQEWLEKLNVFSWQDLVILAPMKNVETLMRSLTIGGYHKHRQDLRKLICFGKICDTTVKQVQPTTKNTRSWHNRYLLRLHNDLPLIPPME